MFLKQILIFCTLTFWFLHANAQEFTGGILGGVTASQIDGDRQSGYNKGGIFLGGYLLRDITDSISARFEMRFVQKGTYNKEYETKTSFQYIEVPLLIQFHKWKTDFGAGIAPGVLLSAKSIADVALEYDLDSYKQFSLDFTAGAEYKIWKNVGATARFSYSIFPIASVSNIYTTRNQYHNVLSFGFFYLLKQ